MDVSDRTQVVRSFERGPLLANPKPWPQPCGSVFQLVLGTVGGGGENGGIAGMRSKDNLWSYLSLPSFQGSKSECQVCRASTFTC